MQNTTEKRDGYGVANEWLTSAEAALYLKIERRTLLQRSEAAGLGHLRSHTFRHTYRTWLDSVGAPTGVQQRLMRHADIRTTMNIYGDVVTADMAEAPGKVVGLALNGMGNGMEPGSSNCKRWWAL